MSVAEAAQGPMQSHARGCATLGTLIGAGLAVIGNAGWIGLSWATAFLCCSELPLGHRLGVDKTFACVPFGGPPCTGRQYI